MLVANFTSKIPTMGNTKTYEDWSTYLGGYAQVKSCELLEALRTNIFLGNQQRS